MKDVSVTGFCWLFFIPVENHSFRNVTIEIYFRHMIGFYGHSGVRDCSSCQH